MALRELIDGRVREPFIAPGPRFDAQAVPCNLLSMSLPRESALLATLTGDPASTSEIYDRVGYATLTRVGLISYDAFRAELAKLVAAGLVHSHVGADGSTMWRLPQADAVDTGETSATDLTPEA